MAKQSLFCLAWLFSFLDFLTSLIEFILWLEFFLQTKGRLKTWGGGPVLGGPTGSCLVTMLLSECCWRILPEGQGMRSLSLQASYGETLTYLCPYSVAHNTCFSINDSQIYWVQHIFKRLMNSSTMFQGLKPIQLMSSALKLNLMQASYLINTQISTFSLNSKTFHLNSTYEEVANFQAKNPKIQKAKQKDNGPATEASNPSNYSGKTHTKLIMVFGLSVRFISLKMEFLSLCRLSFFQ